MAIFVIDGESVLEIPQTEEGERYALYPAALDEEFEDFWGGLCRINRNTRPFETLKWQDIQYLPAPYVNTNVTYFATNETMRQAYERLLAQGGEQQGTADGDYFVVPEGMNAGQGLRGIITNLAQQGYQGPYDAETTIAVDIETPQRRGVFTPLPGVTVDVIDGEGGE